ncbi:MAG TPA: lysylphosphatidylglycerol synthase domain-containing protein [Longimicrobiaceae bacterium]|nr:lysylphosphatidylglycerol synthase domain-containing protein [Longimicrobiaceae bacterium]
MKLPPRLRRPLTFALVAAAFFYLGREIWRNAAQLRSFDWEVRPALLALSVVLFSAVLLWGVVVWRMLLRHFGAEVPFRALARAWFLANLSKYIPGVVWQFVSLAQLGPSVGLRPAAIVTTLLVQMGFLLLSAWVVGAWLLPAAYAGELATALLALRWLSPLALALVHPAVVGGGLRVVERVARREVVAWGGSWAEGVKILLVSAVSWLLSGAAFHLFLASFVELPLSALPAVTAINALAWVAGFLVFFAPGGLGFKEAAMALLLGGLVPAGVAAALSVASRLWTIAGEVLPALFLARGRPHEAPEAPDPSVTP